MNLKAAYSEVGLLSIGGLAMDVETRLQQVATVINQIDDYREQRLAEKEVTK